MPDVRAADDRHRAAHSRNLYPGGLCRRQPRLQRERCVGATTEERGYPNRSCLLMRGTSRAHQAEISQEAVRTSETPRRRSALDGRWFPGQASRSAGCWHCDLASGRRGQQSGSPQHDLCLVQHDLRSAWPVRCAAELRHTRSRRRRDAPPCSDAFVPGVRPLRADPARRAEVRVVTRVQEKRPIRHGISGHAPGFT